MPSVCSNASWKTWTPLPDRFTDEHLVENVPTLRPGMTSAGQRHESGCDKKCSCSLPNKSQTWKVLLLCTELTKLRCF